VTKYTRSFPNHQERKETTPRDTKRTVLLTGSTGGLGCYVLALLASDPGVSRIYALNRGSQDGTGLRQRQELALIDRGLDISIMNLDSIVFVETDFSAPRLGVPEHVYLEMQRSVTHIIHNAWPVDFNLSLMSFEPNVRGLRNLIDFSLSSPHAQPPKLIFTSSVGVFQNIQSSHPLSESAIEPEIAVANGYSESKWVAEAILAEARAQTTLQPLVVRVGQLCGGPNGAWNIKEWVPALVQSAETVQCIPQDDREVTWLPVNVAASALVDFLEAPSSTPIVHLIHPRPVTWSTLAAILSSELSVPVVSYATWLEKVEKLALLGVDGPTPAETQVTNLRVLRLLPFFRSIAQQSDGLIRDAMGFPKLSASQAVVLSETLAESRILRISAEDVKQWLGYWRRAKLLHA